jgi:hypothetical protein
MQRQNKQINGTDQRCNVRSRSKELIRDATSEQIKGADQRHNIRQIKGANQRHNVRGDQRSQIRAATKKPAIRGPTKVKNQHGSEEHTL